MRDRDEVEFSGTFAGEASEPRAKETAPPSNLTKRQAAALSKYEIDPNKPVKVRTPAPRVSFLRIAITMCSAVVACTLAGVLLYELNPRKTFGSYVGEVLLFVAVMFVVALMYVAGRRRR